MKHKTWKDWEFLSREIDHSDQNLRTLKRNLNFIAPDVKYVKYTFYLKNGEAHTIDFENEKAMIDLACDMKKKFVQGKAEKNKALNKKFEAIKFL